MNDLLNGPGVLDVPAIEGELPTCADWAESLRTASINGSELVQLPIKLRECLVGRWFREADLGYVFAPRGVGKTWLATQMALSLAAGGKFGPWQATKPRRVLYVDGEMALDLTQNRLRLLCPEGSQNLALMHHELLFERTGKVLNLAAPLIQEALLEHAMANQIEVLILDNLSCLFSGVKENDADAWELILPWLLQLRRRGIAVVIVAHAGRNGFMRGTSRREDSAAWILSLSEPPAVSPANTGARFVAKFTKCRNTTSDEIPTLEWHFKPTSEERVEVCCHVADQLMVFKGWVEEGLDTCGDIAAEMGISKGTVSKLAKRAQRAGWLTLKGRRYVLSATSPSRQPYTD